MVRFSGDVVIKPGEVVQGNVAAMQGDIDVGGRVLGNVTALAGDITLRAGSFVDGNVVALAGDVHREQGAQVLGQITTREEIRTPAGQYYLPSAHRVHPEERFWSRVGGWFLFLLGLLALTAIVMALFPEKMNAMKNSLAANPARHLAVGFLGWIALPVALLALALTIVGIPVAVVTVFALPVVALIGAVLLGLIVGEQVERALAKRWPRAAGQTLLVQALIGVALLWLAQAVPLVGWLIWPLVAVFGLGAALATRFGTNRPWFNGRGPTPKPAPDSADGAPGAVPEAVSAGSAASAPGAAPAEVASATSAADAPGAPPKNPPADEKFSAKEDLPREKSNPPGSADPGGAGETAEDSGEKSSKTPENR